MRGKGINYDTGFSPGGRLSREDFDPAIVLPSRLNGFLAETAAVVRGRFAGPVTYASGMWEPVELDAV